MMLKHPRVLHLAQAEVDNVLGNGPLDIKHIDKLKYIEAVLRETIRLHPTVTAIGRHTKSGKDELIGGGKYRIGAKDVAILGIAALHRDPAVWGEDANDFRPERMLNGGFEALPPNSWKPFGHGVRACIGRGFAWQEATIAVALILQRFQIEMADPSYELKIRQTLTIKPVGFRMKVRLRPGKSVFTGLITEPGVVEKTSPEQQSQSIAALAPLSIFYGSNQGTCKNFAESLQAAAASHGYAVTVGTLDSATEHVPIDQPIVFITPSYEGQPPDNGRKFVTWLESVQDKQDSLRGVKYAIFGCGNPDWVLTYHRIPKLIEDILDRTGASKFCPTGLGNAAGDIVGAFDAFSEQMWAALRPSGGKAEAANEELQVKITVDRPEMLSEKDMTLGTVRQHFQIADTSVGPRKMMMDVELPGDVTYQAGDYLVVLPTNHRHNVRRVLQRFDMPVDALVKLSGTKKSFLVRQFLPQKMRRAQLTAKATRPDRIRIQHHRCICRNRHADLTQTAPSPCLSNDCHDTKSRARTSRRDSLRVGCAVEKSQHHRPPRAVPSLQPLFRRLPRHAPTDEAPPILNRIFAVGIPSKHRQHPLRRPQRTVGVQPFNTLPRRGIDLPSRHARRRQNPRLHSSHKYTVPPASRSSHADHHDLRWHRSRSNASFHARARGHRESPAESQYGHRAPLLWLPRSGERLHLCCRVGSVGSGRSSDDKAMLLASSRGEWRSQVRGQEAGGGQGRDCGAVSVWGEDFPLWECEQACEECE